MMITIIKVFVLLCFLIIPLRGPSKRKKTAHERPNQTTETCSNYGVNEHGELEQIFNDNTDKESFL
jgi:hypothetical protein